MKVVALELIAKDDFPTILVADWAVRSEAHETITLPCHTGEGVKSGLSRLETGRSGQERQFTELPIGEDETSLVIGPSKQ